MCNSITTSESTEKTALLRTKSGAKPPNLKIFYDRVLFSLSIHWDTVHVRVGFVID